MRHPRSRVLRIARVRIRRFLARAERRTPLWALWITPWGTSIVLHGLFLFLFAVYFYVYVRDKNDRRLDDAIDTSLFASQLTEDLTSLTRADQAGDPFTKLKSSEPPSLSLQPPDPTTTRINAPELPKGMTYGSEVRLNVSEISRNVSKLTEGPGVVGMNLGPMTAPFSGRSGDVKAKLIRREGGTVESEKSVVMGLDWIARHQRADGSWSMDTRGQCQGGQPCPEDPSLATDTAATGLALLPFLAAGVSHTEAHKHREVLKNGLSWLLRNQRSTGEIYLGGARNARLYSHAIATMTLCEAYGISKDKRLRDPAQKAINWIVNAQNKLDGGWRYEPGAPGDTSVFGWQIFALRSAKLAGLNVPQTTLRRCRVYLDLAAADEMKSTYSYMPGRRPSIVMTAEGLLARQILGWARDYPPMLQGAALVSADLQQSTARNIYYWYYATQLLHNLQGKDWERWNKTVRDGLIQIQVGGTGCDRGSWDPLQPEPDVWGEEAGRLYVTSLSLLTLEVYYRYLPLYRAKDEKLEGNDDPPATAEEAEPRRATPAQQGPARLPAPSAAPSDSKPRSGRRTN